MVPRTIAPLVCTSLWALPTAVAATLWLPLAAVLAAAGTLWALASRGPLRCAGLAALPACLAALPPPAEPSPVVPVGPIAVDGVVDAIVRTPELDAVHVWVGGGPQPLQLALDGDLEVLPGDRLAILAHAAAPAAPGLPPAVRAITATARVAPGPTSLRRLAAAARRALERQLLAHVPGNGGAMLGALVLGRDTRPGRELRDAHRATGLSHLLAVSGAHAAMLAFLLGLAGWHGRRRLGASRTRTVVVLGLLAVYAAITGNEPPVLRAVAAYTLAAIAVHLGRPCGVVPLLLAPAMLTALVRPDALLGPSFLLSYAAVAGLALAGPPRTDTAWQRWLATPLLASAWATLATAPLTLSFFGQLAPWTVVLTPLLAPVVAALLLGGLALALCGLLVPWAATALALPVGALANGYAALVQWADLLPATPIPATAAPPPWLLALVALGALAFVAWRPSRRRCALAALAACVPHFVPVVPAPGARLELFAIGHGQACLVTTAAGARVAIDCGSLQHPFLAARRLVDALPARRLDALVVTHADADHHNGVAQLLGSVRVALAVLPQALADGALADALRAHGCRLLVLAPGAGAVPAAGIRVHAPPVPPAASDNDASLWASADVGGLRVLMTGDAQELGVATALAGGIATPHDVLVLPHHGRANANAVHLLRAVRPRCCLASAAAADGDTPQGALVRQRGAELWVTGRHGSLRLERGADGTPLVHGDAAIVRPPPAR
jgi:competence protein ComEC